MVLPDPFGDDYLYSNSCSNSWTGLLDISGCIVGHDGSGGKEARQVRTRRCGFGVAVVRMLADGSLVEVGVAAGSAPGKQTVLRSEMTGLLHAPLHTKGEAIFQCDNRGVYNTFLKGPRAQPRYNGILWNLIFRAAKNRYDSGHGNIKV